MYFKKPGENFPKTFGNPDNSPRDETRSQNVAWADVDGRAV